MLKDHLGNVRMVLTEEQKQDIYPAATLENTTYNGGTAVSVEDDYYTISSGNIADQSAASGIPTYANNNGNPPANNNPYSNSTANSQKLYRINGNDAGKTGLGITLKVMAGDRIDIFGKSYYYQSGGGGTSTTTPAAMVLEILNGLLGGPTGGAAGAAHGGVTAGQLNSLPGTTGGIYNMISQQASGGSGDPLPPRAYINCLFFDEQFKFVDGYFSQAGSQNQLKDHFSELQNKVAQKNGYVYIYVSNESPVNVFFDNLQVVHTRGPILEETHYYPFGLTMNGISSKAFEFGEPRNKEKTFQGQRFDDELELNWVQFKWRNHDPQIGRFIEIDPLAEEYEYNSTYAFSENKVISHVELEGLEAVEIIIGGAEGVGAGTVITAAVMAAPILLVVTHPEVLVSGGASAAQMDLKVERQVRTNSRSTSSPVETTNKAGNSATSAGTAASSLRTIKPLYNGVGSGIANEGRVFANSNHGGGKNAQHANQKAKDVARKKYEEARERYFELKSKTNKTKEDKKAEEKAKTEMNHLRRKMEEGGENHSQKAKGSN